MHRRDLLVGAGAAVLGAACSTTTASAQSSLAADIDAAVNHAMTRIGIIPGLAVAAYTREGVYTRGFGVTDVDTRRAANADTSFYIASSTKPLTALALATLETRRDIDLNTPLATYSPDANFPANVRANEVNFRHLMSHASGVENNGISFRVAFSGEHDPQTLWRLLSASKPNAEAPLGTFQYTNTGYNIATVLTDRKLGVRWQDLLQREVFGPAGMRHATAMMSRARWQVAKPHNYDATTQRPKRIYLEKVDQTMQSAGGVVMSANDAVRWLELMCEEGRIGRRQIVPAAAVQAVKQPQVRVPPETVFGGYTREQYALGWYHGPHRDEVLLHHFGGFAGARAHVSFIPARRVGVAVFINDSSAPASVVDAIANYIYDRTAGRADARTTYDAALDALVGRIEQGRTRVLTDLANRAQRPWTLTKPRAAYAGRYVSQDLGTADISVAGDDITVRAGVMRAVATAFTQPDSIRVELVPGQGAAIVFEMGSGDNPVAFTTQGERFVRQA